MLLILVGTRYINCRDNAVRVELVTTCAIHFTFSFVLKILCLHYWKNNVVMIRI
jgi:hypothetical protein